MRNFPGTIGDALDWAHSFEDAKAVVVLVKDSDDCWVASWSRMRISELVYAHRILESHVNDQINARREP